MATLALPDTPPEEANNPGQDEYEKLTSKVGGQEDNSARQSGEPAGSPSQPNRDSLSEAESNPGQTGAYEKQVGRGYRRSQLQKSKFLGLGPPVGGRKFWIAGGISSLLVIIIVALFAFLFPTLKIPQLAAEIEGYRLARLTRTYYNYASIMTNDANAIDATASTTTKDLVGRTPLGKAISLYRPLTVVNKMKANSVMQFEYDNSGKLTHVRFNLKNGTSRTIAVPDYKYSANPKDLASNYKERLRYASEINSALSEALDGSNFLVRSRVGRLLQAAEGVHLFAFERAGLLFKNLSSKDADIKMAQTTEQAVTEQPTEEPHTKALKNESEDIKKIYNDCFTDPACTQDAIDNNGIPTKVKDALRKVSAKGSTTLSIINPAYALSFPVCIAYDASKNVATTVMNSQNAEAIRLFFLVASGADQQRKGDVTLEAVGALGREAGDIAGSVPDQLANGKPVDTSNEGSPQAGPAGEYSILNAFDSLIGGGGNTTRDKIANAFADKLCPVITDQKTAIATAAINFILAIDPLGGSEAEGAIEGSAQGIIKVIGQKIADRITTKETFNAVRNTARDVGIQETASLGMTYVARMIVFSQLGATISGLDKTDFANQADMGATAYGNQMVQQQTFGRPLTPSETTSVEKRDVAYLQQKNQSQSAYNRYLALSNPYSLTSRFAIAVSSFKFSDITGWFVHFPHTLSNIFAPLRLFGGHSLAAGAGNANYGMVQFGWSTDEEDLINNDPSYDPIINDQIVHDPVNAANIAKISQTYAKCFGYSADSAGNLTYDPNIQIGNLLGGESPPIPRDDNGDVTQSGGTCSPDKLSYNSTDAVAMDTSSLNTSGKPSDLIFRWRLDHSFQNVLNDLTDIQSQSG